MFRWLFNRRALVVLASLVAVIILVTATARLRTNASAPEAWLLDGLSPIARMAQTITETIKRGQATVAEIGRLRAENERLREELADLRAKEIVFDRAIAAHTRLRALLGLKERMPDPVAAAAVIFRHPDHWLEQLVVGVGAADGVAVDMVAVDPQGVVGRVLRVTNRTATILLLTDAQSGVGVAVERSGDLGVAFGAPNGDGTLEVRFFSRDPDVEVGDRLVTSGHGAVFPPGLPVGTVHSLVNDASGLLQLAVIEPVVDFDRLHEVLIINSVRAGGEPEAATDDEQSPAEELE